MNRNEAISALTGLARLDTDAYFAYSHALEHLEDGVLRERFTRIRNEHLVHVQALREAIGDAGGEPPALTRDFRGLMLEGMALFRRLAGKDGVVHAMCSIEKIVTRNYAETLALGLPDDLQMLCERLFADSASHGAVVRGVPGVDKPTLPELAKVRAHV